MVFYVAFKISKSIKDSYLIQHKSFGFSQLNRFKNCYSTLIILININNSLK